MKIKNIRTSLLLWFSGLCIIFTGLVIISCSDSTEPTKIVFTALPYASDNYWLSFAEGITDDGSIVFGSSAVNTPDNGKYFEIAPVFWIDENITVLPFMNLPVSYLARQSAVYDISDNGIMVGHEAIGDLSPLGYYYEGDQWNKIGDSEESYVQTATGISGDGNIIVGLSNESQVEMGGYYYNMMSEELNILASTFKDSVNYTNAQTNLFDISEDGTILVGSDSAVKFDNIVVELPIYFDMAKDTLPSLLPLPSGYIGGIASAISNDGSTILGKVYDEAETPYAAYWDNNLQVHVLDTFSPYPGPDQPATIAHAASNNGDRIVGTSYEIAFIKFNNGQMVHLQDWLEDQGLTSELADWNLITATGITPDGHWIVGTGRDGVYSRAFKVYIP